jgi:dsRNA-specific ribonuclease
MTDDEFYATATAKLRTIEIHKEATDDTIKKIIGAVKKKSVVDRTLEKIDKHCQDEIKAEKKEKKVEAYKKCVKTICESGSGIQGIEILPLFIRNCYDKVINTYLHKINPTIVEY